MRYFVITDVHGFYDEMREGLNAAGFNPDKDFLISCGDMFDRGPKSPEVLEYLMGLAPERRAFVRGNHEDLLEDLVWGKEFASMREVSNGTAKTIAQFTGCKKDEWEAHLNELRENKLLNEYFGSLLDCYNVGKYLFVHGWYAEGESKEEWRKARWSNGFDSWYINGSPVGKTVVCGHIHTSYAHRRFHHKGKEFPNKRAQISLDQCCFEPFVDEGIIGLDACTVLTHKVNVMGFEA